MASSVKTIQDLNLARQQIQSAFEQKSIEGQQILEAGDQLGAAKVGQQLLDLKSLLEKTDLDIQRNRDVLKNKVADGTILDEDLGDVTGELPTTMEGINKKVKTAISAYAGADFDPNDGLGFDERKNLAFLQPENKEKYLKGKYGDDNVFTMNVMGHPMTAVRSENGKIVPVDEFNTTWMDAVDAFGEIVPLGGSVIGGAVGTATMRTPMGTAIGSATGYTIAGALQDQVARSVFKVGDNFINAIPRRATEAAVGLPIEYGVIKATMPVARLAGKAKYGKTTARAEQFNKAEQLFADAGYKTNLSAIASGSVKQQNKLLQAGERLANSALGRDILVGAQRIRQFMDDTVDPAKLPSTLSDDALKALKMENELLVDYVRIHDDKVANSLKNLLSDQEYNLMVKPPNSSEDIGKYLYADIAKAKAAAEKAKTEIYDPFYQKANEIVSIDPEDVARAIETPYYGGTSRPAEVQNLINKIRQRTKNATKLQKYEERLAGSLTEKKRDFIEKEVRRLKEISGPLNATQLDSTFRELRDLAPSGPLAGSGAGELKMATGKSSKALQNFRDDIYRNAGIFDEWNNASNAYRNFKQFNDETLGAILETRLTPAKAQGGAVIESPALAGRDMLKQIFKSPENTRDIINAVASNDPQNLPIFVNRLRDNYLQHIGLSGKQKGFSNKFEFDEDLVRTLYGTDNQYQGTAMVNNLNKLKTYFEAQKLPASKITDKDIASLQGAFSKDSVDGLVKSIGDRAKAAQDVEKFVWNKLIKDATLGHVEVVSRAEFPKAMFSASPDQVKRVLSALPPKEQKALRESYHEYVFSRYPGDPDSTIGRYELFDGNRLLRDVRENPAIEENMKAVLGEDQTKNLLSAARLTDATKTGPAFRGVDVTGVVTQGGAGQAPVQARMFAPVQSIMASVSDRWTSILYKSGELAPVLREISKKELSPEAYNKVVSQGLNRALFSAQGLQALTESGKYDPEYSYWLGSQIGTIANPAVKYAREYGFLRNPPEELNENKD